MPKVDWHGKSLVIMYKNKPLRIQIFTLSKDPLCIISKGGRYKEARLSGRLFDVGPCPWSFSQTPERLDSSWKLRKATVDELGLSLNQTDIESLVITK